MYQRRRGDRRRERVRWSVPAVRLAGADVVLVGFFSARTKDFAERMDAATAALTARDARIVGRFVQRRGVSDGGVRKMDLPLSSRTLLSSGKVREVAAACADADIAVFVAALSTRQQRVLTELFGCPAVSLAEALAAG